MYFSEHRCFVLQVYYTSIFTLSLIKSCYLEDGVQDKSNKGAGVLLAISSSGTLGELSIFHIIVPRIIQDM